MDLTAIYRIGWNITVLNNQSTLFSSGITKILEMDDIKDFKRIYNLIELISRDLNKLSIASKTILDFKSIITKYDNILSKETKEDNIKEKLSNWVNDVNKKILIWDDRIQSELANLKVKKLYVDTLINPKKILNGAQSFFTQKIWKKMTELEKQDLEDGCACILAEAWTPAAMIIMRSIESGLRIFFKRSTKKEPSEKNWGGIINELKEKENIDSQFLGHFDYLREFRNRLSHPDARFTQEETEDVLNQAIHIFNRLYS